MCCFVEVCVKMMACQFQCQFLLFSCLNERQAIIKRDYALEKPQHDQKQNCAEGEHTRAQFTIVLMLGLGAVFFSIEAVI